MNEKEFKSQKEIQQQQDAVFVKAFAEMEDNLQVVIMMLKALKNAINTTKSQRGVK